MSLLLLVAPLALAACQDIRAFLVEVVPQDYAAGTDGAGDPAHLASSWDGTDVTDQRQPIKLEQVVDGYPKVTDIQFPPGRSDLMVVLQKEGAAHAVTLATGDAKQILDLDVQTSSELGLLGLAFHPEWPTDPRVFVDYNPDSKLLGEGGEPFTRISSFRLDPASWKARDEVVLLEVAQPYANHDAGQLAFGPDGMLYIGLGDGGWRDDPHGNGQNAATLLGSMLRVDVDRQDQGKAYAVPLDNPFIGKPAPTPQTAGPVPPELWAIGLRNPWRYSFHSDGRLIVADVGQNTWEEVDIVSAGDNLGWKIREAAHCFPPKTRSCPTDGFVDPVFAYDHEVGQSITGGYTYSASDLPALQDRWIVGDFTRGWIWALQLPDQPGQPADVLSLGRFPVLISTFGRDAAGRVYVGDYGEGRIYRIAPAG